MHHNASPIALAKTRSMSTSTPPGTPAGTAETVLIMNHHRDSLDALLVGVREAGLRVSETTSLSDTYRYLERARPSVLVVNPLVLRAGGLEMEIVEALQRDDDPIPAILLLENERQLEQARRLALPFRDFLIKPHSAAECVHRIELALQSKHTHLALVKKVHDLESQVSIDPKTGLLSERYLRRVMQIEFKRSQRHQTPMSLLLVDIDNFKSINDTTEYAFGDEVLRAVAECLRAGTRETDFAARFGGDEFVLLLPQTTPAEAVQTAIRIRKLIGSLLINNGTYSSKVTISVGIDTYDGRAPTGPEDLRRRANKALQEAKRRGKNQVWLYSDLASDPQPPPTAP